MVNVKGEVTLRLLEDGHVLQEMTQHNLITDWNRRWMAYQSIGNYNSGIPNVMNGLFVHNVAVNPTYWMNSIPNFNAAGGTFYKTPDTTVRDVNGRSVTYTGTFPAPTVDRTIKTVGLLSGYGSISGGKVWGCVGTIASLLRLNTPITQTTTQTLEMQYRVTFSR